MDEFISRKGQSIFALFLVICVLFTVDCVCDVSVSAREKTESIIGKLYEFEKDSKYEISTVESSKATTSDFGSFKIAGNLNSISELMKY